MNKINNKLLLITSDVSDPHLALSLLPMNRGFLMLMPNPLGFSNPHIAMQTLFIAHLKQPPTPVNIEAAIPVYSDASIPVSIKPALPPFYITKKNLSNIDLNDIIEKSDQFFDTAHNILIIFDKVNTNDIAQTIAKLKGLLQQEYKRDFKQEIFCEFLFCFTDSSTATKLLDDGQDILLGTTDEMPDSL